jgi:hypothetical protein
MRQFILMLAALLPVAVMAQNVGIGTTSPGYKLDVLGNGGYRGPVLSKNGSRVAGGTLFISNNDGSGQTLRMDGSNIQASYSDPLVFPPQNLTSAMVLNPYGGNVGIGTNFSPEYKLHIWSSTDQLIKIDGSNSLILFHDNVSNAQYGFFRAWTNSPFNPAGYYGLEMGTPPSTGSDPAKRLMFSTNYNLRLTIMEDGKVGVNTTAPNSKLEVNGSLSMPLRQVDALQDNLTYNITDDDYTIVANMQGLAVAGRVMNLVLPSPVGRKGRLYNITALNLGQNSSNLAGGVRIFVNSVVAGTQIWTLQFRIYPDLSIISFDSMVTLQSDGAQWLPVSSNHYQHPYQP